MSKRFLQRRTKRASQFVYMNARESVSVPEDIDKFLREKLILQNSQFSGGDLLYYIKIMKRNKSDDSVQLSQKIIGVLRKGVEIDDLHIFQLSLKSKSVDVKNLWNLKLIKALDTSGDLDLIVSLDNNDYLFSFESKIERDECLWTIYNLCKYCLCIDVFLGYSIDMESISFAVLGSGFLTRFASLQRSLFADGQAKLSIFGEEDVEGEKLLEELDWSEEGSLVRDLQNKLNSQNDQINMEIISFLLQWEEADSKLGSVDKKDTVEILDALNDVDKQLSVVDDWLSEQVMKLSDVQGNLHVIEDESGGLESSWQNLQNIHQILKVVVEKLSLSPEEISILQNCKDIIVTSLQASDISSIEPLLAPLVDSVKSLKRALTFKGEKNKSKMSEKQTDKNKTNESDVIVTRKLWRKIQSIAAITVQKQILLDIADNFYSNATEYISTVFSGLLKHRALNDENHGKTLSIKSFRLQSVLNSLVQSDSNSSYSPCKENMFVAVQHMFHEAISKYFPLIEQLVDLTPTSVVSLSHSYLEAIGDGLYSSLFKSMWKEIKSLSVAKRNPLTMASIAKFKAGASREPSLKFLPSATSSKADDSFSSWVLLESILIVILPAMKEEETTFEKLFRYDKLRTSHRYYDWTKAVLSWNDSLPIKMSRSKLENQYEVIWSQAFILLEKLTSQSSLFSVSTNSVTFLETDTAEVIGCLSTLFNFVNRKIMMYLNEVSSVVPSSSASIDTSSEDNVSSKTSSENPVSVSFLLLLDVLYGKLSDRVETLGIEQSKWIQTQKGDPKHAGVSSVVAKFASWLLQVEEMVHYQNIQCVFDMIVVVGGEVNQWITSLAAQNDKYSDIVLISNFRFLENALEKTSLQVIQEMRQNWKRISLEAEHRYVLWMVTYEFPSLSDLAARLEGVGAVKEEELALYVRRKDVVGVAKDLDTKTLESSVHTMKKRLEKHFLGDDDQNQSLIDQLWSQIREKTVDIVRKVESTASISYQITLEVSPEKVLLIFSSTK